MIPAIIVMALSPCSAFFVVMLFSGFPAFAVVD
jgi:hypothetical protein